MIASVRNVAAGLLAGALLTGCSNSSANGLDLQTPAPEKTGTTGAVSSPSAATTRSPSVAPTPVPKPLTEKQKVLAGYEAFWESFGPLGQMSAAERPAALRAVAVEPLIAATLKELARRDAANQVSYGRTGTRPEVSLLQGASAAVRDCQNTSASGLMDKTTGKKLTVGVPAYLRLSEMKRGTDGVWRITTINAYPNAKC